jgi:ATP-dependent Lon protease
MTPDNESASASSAASGKVDTVSIPGDALIIVPVRNMVLFPGLVTPITINRAK